VKTGCSLIKEDVKSAKALLRRMDDLAERRERNPLTKVEELEEANYIRKCQEQFPHCTWKTTDIRI